MAKRAADFTAYIKCVGTGPKHNRDLTPEQMRDAMAQMLSQKAAPEQISAFLLGWRLKPESVEELKAALEVLDSLTRRTPVAQSVELGYPFDGKADNPYLFPLAAETVAPFDLRVVVSGGALQPAKGGLSVRRVCRHIALPANLYYFDRSEYCPPLAALSGIRQKLGIRTAFNTLERLPNPGLSDTALVGVFHKPFVRKYLEIFAPRYRRLMIVKGNEGTPEIFGRCRVWLHTEGAIQEYTIDPARYGVTYQKSFRRIDEADSLAALKEPSDALRALARLNGALWLWAKGMAKDLDDGWEMTGG